LIRLREDPSDIEPVQTQTTIALGDVAPGAEQPLPTARHAPDGLPFVEEVHAALDLQLVQGGVDPGAVEPIDEIVERPPDADQGRVEHLHGWSADGRSRARIASVLG
jgi:hypothetical protein